MVESSDVSAGVDSSHNGREEIGRIGEGAINLVEWPRLESLLYSKEQFEKP